MNEQKNPKSLDELLSRTIGGKVLEFDCDRWKKEHPEDVRQFEEKAQRRTTHNRSLIDGCRIILKSRITKLAAAAVIIAAVLVGLRHFGSPVALTAPAFGEVVENVLSQKWVYMFEENRKTGQIDAEYWYSPAEQKLYAKSHTVEGNAFMLDMNAGEKHEYRGDTISISKPDDFGHTTGWLEQRLPMLGGLLTRYESEGADIVQRDAVYNSRPALLYEVEMTLPDGEDFRTNKYLWVVDSKTHLPIICEYTQLYRYERKGKFGQILVLSQRYAFDYSESGPEDIYALGVPTDANVIDERPSAEIQELIERINEAKATTHSSFAAVICEGDMLERRVIRQGERFRDEFLELAINGSDWELQKKQYLEAMGDTFASINGWLNEARVVRRSIIRIRDGRFSYETYGSDISENRPVRMRRQWRNNDEFTRYCWWAMPRGKIVTTEYSKEHGLICTDSGEVLNYYDPSKDYLWVRYEKKNGQVPYEVLEFARTASGMWYPHKVRMSDSQYVIYADDLNAELAKELNPESLPNYVDHRELTQQIKMQMQEDANDKSLEYTGFTPLHMAIYRQDIDRVKKYLSEGAEVEPAYDSGATPMELAVASGNLEMVKLLFKHGAGFISNDTEQRSCLGLAATKGYYDIVEFMLANGSDIDGVYKQGATALHYTAENGDIRMVNLLLAHGAKVDLKDQEGQTCLYRAITNVADKLFNPKPTDQQTMERFTQVIRVLVENGADINALNREKYSAFSRAVSCLVNDKRNAEQQLDFLKFLLEMGADPNLDAASGSNSSFWRAVENRRYDIIKVMLDGGADPWLITTHDYWPSRYNLLHCARIRKDDKLYELLYPYMKDRYEQTNEELLELAARVLRASVDDDMETIGLICVDYPRQAEPWTILAKEIKKLYEGHEGLLDKMVPGWFTLDGLAEVYVPLPEGMKDKSILLGFIQYPNGQWKCMEYERVKNMPEYEGSYGGRFIQHGQFLGRFRNYMYDQAGMTERVTTRDKGNSTLYGKFQGRCILTVEDGALRVDFDEKGWRKRYMLLTANRVKEYWGNTLLVYLKERVHTQKDYPQRLIFRPGTMIVENGDSKHVFTVSEGQVLLTHGGKSTKADRFIFDLETYEVVSSE